MRFTRIELNDFTSYGKQEVNLDELNYVAIAGRNGSGKSSIALGIAWALFGTARVKGDPDSVIRDGQNKCSVVLEFVADGTNWRIVRSKSRGKSSMQVRLFNQGADGDWEPVGDHLNKTSQALIGELVGMSEDAFYSLTIIDGDSGVRFVKADSAVRREILLNLLPEMAQWPKLEAKAREDAKAARDSVAEEQARIEADEERLADARERAREAQDELDALDVDSLTKTAATVESDIAKVTKRIEGAAAEEQAALDKFDSQSEVRVSKLDSAIVEAKSAEEKASSALRRLVRIERDLDEAREDEKEAKGNIDRLGINLDRAREALDKANKELADAPTKEFIESKSKALGAAEGRISMEKRSLRGLTEMQEEHQAECPTCQTHLDDDALSALIAKVEKALHTAEDEADALDEEIADAKAERKKSTRAVDEAQAEVESCNRALQRANEQEADAAEDIDELRLRLSDTLEEESVQSVDEAEELANAAAEATAKARSKRDEYSADAGKVRRDLVDALNAAREDAESGKDGDLLEDLRESKRSLTEKIRHADSTRGRIESLNETASSIGSRMRERRDEVRDTLELIESLEQVVNACRPQGVPSMLLDSILAPIEAEATKILNTIPGGEGMGIRFEQVRANRTRAGGKEVLDIIVSLPSGSERRIESLSSGETVRVSMSLIFAMINILGARRSTGSLNTVFLDEPLGPLDQEAVPAFVEVLRSAVSSGTLASVMVVAHDQRVIDALPQRIEVEREGMGVSRAEVIA